MGMLSINPTTEEVLEEFAEDLPNIVDEKLTRAETAFQDWRKKTIAERKSYFEKLVSVLTKEKETAAKLMTLEMGKTYTSSLAEVEKCILTFRYYLQNIDSMLEIEFVDTEYSESYVSFSPLGVVLAIMPWNFPFWQVMRFAAPALLGGNVAVLKHASNVPQSAKLIERLFIAAGFPTGVFQVLMIGADKVAEVISRPEIKAITLTGSEQAGRVVAELAGRELKPCVLELGGSDPFIVLEDAELEEVAANAVKARILNNGQSCIAAKRMLIADKVYEKFISIFQSKFAEIKIGDPMSNGVELGPIATKKGLEELLMQIELATRHGAKLVCGGKRVKKRGYFLSPGFITDIDQSNPIYRQEVFGPIASVYKFKDINQLLSLANATNYGLGASIWTKDIEKAKEIVPLIESGSVYINKIVGSDPRLPFGGIKASGFGRELSRYGVMEFQNIKSTIIT